VIYTLEANLTTYATADAAAVLLAAQAAADAYVADRRAGLGRDLISSQVIKALSVEGVYKVALVGWVDREVSSSEWADGSVTLHLSGTANG
jgi:phage-related baseplate assembly protein